MPPFAYHNFMAIRLQFGNVQKKEEKFLAVYFVDTENMGGVWVRYIKDARPGDLFLLFYTNNSHAIDFSLLKQITASRAKFECISCYVGTNALDFQLITELGFRIAKKPLLDYIVLTKDKGFDAAVKYWQDRGIHIERQCVETPGPEISVLVKPISPQPAANLEPPKPTPKPVVKQQPIAVIYTQKMLAIGIVNQKAQKAGQIIQNAMALPPKKRLGAIYQKMLAEFGQQKGLKLYQQVKPLLAGINKN